MSNLGGGLTGFGFPCCSTKNGFNEKATGQSASWYMETTKRIVFRTTHKASVKDT